MSQAVFQKVAEIIGASKNVSPSEITLDTKFRELDIDSLAALSLVYDFEETFNVALPDEDVLKIKTVRDVVESLERLNVTV